DVITTTGCLWWKKEHTETRQIFRDEMGINWMWVDNGKWTPEYQVESLYNGWRAKEAIEKGEV
ncbi:MAG: hypothetical protein LC687_03790, partial [Actinobacteria bacterium]|nr:hypothetical protein [Actinomycetota bacterium]